jgi:hypothetical protein
MGRGISEKALEYLAKNNLAGTDCSQELCTVNFNEMRIKKKKKKKTTSQGVFVFVLDWHLFV